METCGTSFEVSQRLFGSLRIVEDFEIRLGRFRRRVGDDRLENWPDCFHPRVKRCRKLAGRREAKAECEPAQSCRFVWVSVGLLCPCYLQTMLDEPRIAMRVHQ